MGRPAVLKVDIVADAKGVGKGVADAESKLGKLGSGAAKVGKLLAVGLAVGAAAAVAVGRSLIQAGERAGTANAMIGNVAKQMDLFGDRTDAVTKRVIAYAEATARQTGVDTNSIKATQAKLLTFGELAKSADQVGGTFDRATAAAIDLAAAGFGSAENNAVQLGKALNDPIKGLTSLSKSGVTFTDTEKARIKTLVESNKVGEAQKLVLAAIEKQVGGTAAATANGSDKMKVAFEQVKERLGLRLMPVFDAFAAFVVDKLLPAAERLAGQLGTKLGPTFDRVAQFVTGTVLPAFRALSSNADGPLTGALRGVATFVGGTVVPVLTTLATFVVGRVIPAAAQLAGPVLGGLRGAFSSVNAAVQQHRPQLEALGGALLAVAGFALKLAPIVGSVLGAAFKVLGGVIGGVISLVANLVSAVQSAINIIGKLASAAKSVGGAVGKLNPFGGPPLATGLPQLVGGVDLAPTSNRLATAAFGDPGSSGGGALAALGRGGLVVLDQRSFPTTVRVDGALDPVAVARQLERILHDQALRLGRLPTLTGGAV